MCSQGARGLAEDLEGVFIEYNSISVGSPFSNFLHSSPLLLKRPSEVNERVSFVCGKECR